MNTFRKPLASISACMQRLLLLAMTTGIAAPHTGMAATPRVKTELEAGAEYDSNLSVIELDKNAAVGDWAAIANARLHGQWQAMDKVKLKGGIGYASKTYQDYSAFDLAIKNAFFDTSYDFKPMTVGFSYHYADAELAAKDFLTLQQRSLYVSRLVNHTLFLRAALNDQDKDFAASRQRNADNHNITGDMFIFFNQGKTLLTAGLTTERETATAHEFDYEGVGLRTSFSHQFPLFNKKNRLQLSWRYDQRNYSAVTPAVQAERSDARRIGTLEWQLEANSWLSLIAKMEHGNYESNLAAANYSETTSLLMLKASF